jgi:hypothetical protein
VTHNVKIEGRDSKIQRQIDVLLEQAIGQHRISIVIDCKDHSQPIDVKGVEEFLGLVKDVRAHQGCIVCPKGFTAAAKRVAENANVALYSLVDTADHKWQTPVALPVLCEFRSVAISFGITVSAPVPFRMPYDFHSSLAVYGLNGEELGTCLETAVRRWNEGEYPTEVGVHRAVPTFASEIRVDNGYGMRVPVELWVELHVTGRRFFGLLPIRDIRGLRDEQTGAVWTNAFTTGGLSPEQVETTWRRLEDDEEPSPVTLRIVGLDCWKVQGERLR